MVIRLTPAYPAGSVGVALLPTTTPPVLQALAWLWGSQPRCGECIGHGLGRGDAFERLGDCRPWSLRVGFGAIGGCV